MDRADAFRQLIPLRREACALAVIDMQRGFLEPGSPMAVPEGLACLEPIGRALAACRGLGIPVVFTRFTYDPQAPTLIGELHPEHKPAGTGRSTGPGTPADCCRLGHPSHALHPALAAEPADWILDKFGYDAFHNTPLATFLHAHRITTLLLSGVMTDVCVLFTASGAVHRGFKVCVLEDAVATLTPPAQAAALGLIGQALGRVMRVEAAIRELEGA